MTTVRNNIWMLSLIIGLITSILSCSKARIEYMKHAEYVYVNKTDYQISFPKPTTTIISGIKNTPKYREFTGIQQYMCCGAEATNPETVTKTIGTIALTAYSPYIIWRCNNKLLLGQAKGRVMEPAYITNGSQAKKTMYREKSWS